MMGISYGGISQLFTAQTQSAEPGRDLAALGTRLNADDPVSGRHPEHRVRPELGKGASPRSQAGGTERRAGLGVPADPERRPDLQGQPGPARPGGKPPGQDPGQRPLRAEGRGPAGADHLREEDQGAGVHGLPVDGRADGRSLPDPGRALHGHPAQVVHVHERDPRRLARSRDLQPLVRLLKALRRQTGADHQRRADPGRRAGDLPGGDGGPGGDDAARSDPAAADLRRGEGRVRAAQADSDPVRQRRGRLPARSARARLRAVVLAGSRSQTPPPGSGTSRTAARSAARRPPAPVRIRSTGGPTPGR